MSNQQPSESQLRIVMTAHSHQLGGMERHVVALSKALVEHGHAVAYAGPMDGWLGEQMQAAGYPCCHAPLNGMYDPVSLWRVVRFAKQFRASVMHGHSQRGGRYADWAAWWLKLPAVATAHSTTSSKWFKSRVHVIAVAQAVKDFLLAQGLSEQQVHMVHLGVTDVPEVIWPADEAITPERPLRMGMVSRVEHVKGHDLAIRAMAILRDRCQLPMELSIVGADDTGWAEYMGRLASECGVEEKVKFLGLRNDIADLMNGFDVLLAPSRREALSLSLIEAAASARPAVACRVGGIPEVVLDGETGILVPSEDVHALADGIEQMSDPHKRMAYGKAARAYYEREFTIEAMCGKTVAVYRQAIAAHQGRSAA